ncbi:MAG: HNH endonuclease [Pyrinomonadaceae bacterium]
MNRFHLPVSLRAEKRCEYCHAPERFSNFAFEVEHILPPLSGGTTHLDNLALACRSCNVFKSRFVTGVDANGDEAGRLFNPRTDVWDEHFQIDPKTFAIKGLSDIGRGTIIRLRINSEMQVNARRLWRISEDIIE